MQRVFEISGRYCSGIQIYLLFCIGLKVAHVESYSTSSGDLPAFTNVEKPHMPLQAIFQSGADTRIEPRTTCRYTI